MTSNISIDKIRLNPIFQMRDITESNVDELAANIKAKGEIVNDLLVRPFPGEVGTYELIAGHRRLKAAKLLDMTVVPCKVRELTDEEAFLVALSENIGRADPTPIEEARAYKTARETFNKTVTQIAESVGKDAATISNRIRLLELPEEIQKAVHEKKLTPGHCEHGFLKLKNDQDRKELYRIVSQRGFTVKDTEEVTKNILDNRKRIEALANYYEKHKDIKQKTCPKCGKPCDANHYRTAIPQNVFCCGDYSCLPWNPLTGEIMKEKRERAESSGELREMQTKAEARAHRSYYPIEGFFKEIAKQISTPGAIDNILITSEWGSDGQVLRIALKDKKIQFPEMKAESKDYKKTDHKTFIRLETFSNDVILKERGKLWTMEEAMGKKPKADIIRDSLNRLVLHHKALSKGVEVEVKSGKGAGTWVFQSVHRDFTARVIDPQGNEILLSEQGVRGLLNAAGFKGGKT